MSFSLIGRAMIISAILFSKAVFFQIYFPQLETAQETFFHLKGIGLYFVSRLKKLSENLDCVFMGCFANLQWQYLLRHSAGLTLSSVTKNISNIQGLAKSAVWFASCCSINFYQPFFQETFNPYLFLTALLFNSSKCYISKAL